MDRALEISPDAPPEYNIRAFTAFFDKTNPEGDKSRTALSEIQKILDTEFHVPAIEIGWFYPSSDIDNEGARTRHGG